MSTDDKLETPACVAAGVYTLGEHNGWTRKRANPWPCPACRALEEAQPSATGPIEKLGEVLRDTMMAILLDDRSDLRKSLSERANAAINDWDNRADR